MLMWAAAKARCAKLGKGQMGSALMVPDFFFGYSR